MPIQYVFVSVCLLLCMYLRWGKAKVENTAKVGRQTGVRVHAIRVYALNDTLLLSSVYKSNYACLHVCLCMCFLFMYVLFVYVCTFCLCMCFVFMFVLFFHVCALCSCLYFLFMYVLFAYVCTFCLCSRALRIASPNSSCLGILRD